MKPDDMGVSSGQFILVFNGGHVLYCMQIIYDECNLISSAPRVDLNIGQGRSLSQMPPIRRSHVSIGDNYVR